MTAPQPANPPLTERVCAAWAQAGELPVDVQGLHTEAAWCSILGLASDVLWVASGRRWRNVEATETVTLDEDPPTCSRIPWGRASFSWGCVPRQSTKVRLPRPDVTAITAVTIDGDPFTRYRLDGNYVVRLDGYGWPPLTTTRITYTFGRLIDHSARLTAILYATELGKAFAGKPCSLPARVTSVTRQGISFDILESLEFLEKGLTGVPAVDSWIKSVNPSGIAQTAVVWSPDIVEARPV